MTKPENYKEQKVSRAKNGYFGTHLGHSKSNFWEDKYLKVAQLAQNLSFLTKIWPLGQFFKQLITWKNEIIIEVPQEPNGNEKPCQQLTQELIGN